MLDALNPEKDAAAIKPVLDSLAAQVTLDVTQKILPELRAQLLEALEGLTMTITITVSKKP